MTLRAIIFSVIFASVSPLMALTPNLPAGTLGPGMVVQTRTGPVNCIVNEPRPHFMPISGRAHGVYAADVTVATGYVYSVRVLQSSGNSGLDNAVLDALRNWRFRPRIIYKLIVPVAFKESKAYLGGG